MLDMRVFLCGLLGVVGALLVGCGNAEDDPTRFNFVMDGSVTPVAAGSVDVGILQDQSTYQPQDVEPLNIVGGAVGGGAAGAKLMPVDEAPEAAAVRKRFATMFGGVFEANVDDVLDSYVDEQVKALRDGEFVDNAYVLVESIEGLWSTLSDKLGDVDLKAALDAPKFIPLFRDLYVASAEITLLSDGSATLTLSPERLQANGEALKPAFLAVLEPMMQSLPLGQFIPGAGGESISPDLIYDQFLASTVAAATMSAGGAGTKFTRVDDSWRQDLGYTLTEDDADGLNVLLLAVIDAVEALDRQLDAAETLDVPTLQQIVQGWALQSGMQVMGASAAVAPLLQRLSGGEMPAMPAGDAMPGDVADAGAETAAVSFAADVLPILTEKCAGCHNPEGRANSGRRPIPLDLSADKAYAQIVGQASSTDPDLKFVVAGDLEASLLYNKVAEDEPTAGRRMPLNNDHLTNEELQKIAAWIQAGAPDN